MHPHLPKTAGLAKTSLVLGLFSLVLLFFTGIPAVICGHLALGKIKRSAGALKGSGLAIAGLILGYCSFGLTLVAILAALVTPVILKTHKKAELVTNISHTKQLYYAIIKFDEKQGQFPDALDELVSQNILTKKEYNKLKYSKNGDWQYFPGQSFDSAQDNILIASPDAELGKWIVLQLNGACKQLDDASYQAALRRMKKP